MKPNNSLLKISRIMVYLTLLVLHLSSYAFDLSKDSIDNSGKGTTIETIYLIQRDILFLEGNQTDDYLIIQLTKRTYEPYKEFWAKYCCKNRETFEYLTRMGLTSLKQSLCKRLPELAEINFESILSDTSNKLYQLIGRKPQGTWHLIFGPGMTDLGAVGGGDMLIDFSHLHTKIDDIKILLPHELAHLIVNTGAVDPDDGTLLKRVIDEGFGTFVGYIYHGDTYSKADNLFYSEKEWQWALDNEIELLRKFENDMLIADKKTENQYATRNIKFSEEAPGAIGYFIGFRIVQSYVKKHGRDSWKDLFDMNSREIWLKSDYRNFVMHK